MVSPALHPGGIGAARRGRRPRRLAAAGLAGALLAVLAWRPEPASVKSSPAPILRAPAAPALMQPAPRTDTLPSQAPSAAETTPASSGVRVLALRQDSRGRWLVRLQIGDEAPRWARMGDVVAHGLRVEGISADGVTLRRGQGLERVPLPGPMAPAAVRQLPASAPAAPVIVGTPGQEAPSSTGIERAIQRATWSSGRATGH